MQLTYNVTRQNPGNQHELFNGNIEAIDPLLSAASISMSFQPEALTDSLIYGFKGEATLSFTDGRLNQEHCSFWGTLGWFPNGTMSYYGCVTYHSLQGTTPAEGLSCVFIGKMMLSGTPTTYSFLLFPPQPASLEVIQPTPQQLQNKEMLYLRGHTVVMSACTLVVSLDVANP